MQQIRSQSEYQRLKPITFPQHFTKDAADLLPVQQDIVRPFDLAFDSPSGSKPFPDRKPCERRKKIQLIHFIRLRSDDHSQRSGCSGNSDPFPVHSATAGCLL